MTAMTRGWSKGGENMPPSGLAEKVLADGGGGGRTSGCAVGCVDDGSASDGGSISGDCGGSSMEEADVDEGGGVDGDIIGDRARRLPA